MNTINLNTATFVGIDCHPSEHTALAMNRFEDEKGILRFDNTREGINAFLTWLPKVETIADNVIVGVEGGGNTRHALVAKLLETYDYVYEVNPLYTKQRRTFGTRPDKSDAADAKLIAEVLTKKRAELPLLTKEEYASQRLSFRKTVWFYEDVTGHGAQIQTQLREIYKERALTLSKQEMHTIDFIIAERRKELKHIRKTQRSLEAQFVQLLKEQGSNLTSIPGIGTILAAKIVAHTNGIERFSSRDKFIRYAGIAPVESSSGKTNRHKYNRKGNRRLHSTFYLAALNQLSWNKDAKAYFEKKLTEGKTKRHALRCLMKRTACIVYGMLKSGEAYRGNNTAVAPE